MKLRAFPQIEGLTYGPVVSRRFGVSLGVNVLPVGQKVCSFNCPYCQLGWTKLRSVPSLRYPGPALIRAAVEEHLRWLARVGLRPDSVTLSGDGEPTLHPRFDEVVEAVRDARAAVKLRAPVILLTNAAHLDRPEVLRGTRRVDVPVFKLDAGNEAMFRRICRPSRGVTLARVIAGIRRFERPVIQTMFVAGPVDNSTDAEVSDWLERLAEIRPGAVQLYTLDREPADRRVRPVRAERLSEIARRVAREAGIEPEVVLPQE